jgi:hypothetical protein
MLVRAVLATEIRASEPVSNGTMLECYGRHAWLNKSVCIKIEAVDFCMVANLRVRCCIKAMSELTYTK